MADCRFQTLNEVGTVNDKDSKNTQKATTIEISLIFKFCVVNENLQRKLPYVVNFAICYRGQQSKFCLH